MSHSPIRWGYHRVSTVHGQSLELGRQELIDAGIRRTRSGVSKYLVSPKRIALS